MTTLQPPNPLDDRLTFPPFPEAPPGVTIIPFKDFKERGIQMFPTENDGIERDGLGIPTVELRVRHDTDTCKTEGKRKRKELPFKITSGVPGVRKEWWEIWEENEESKRTGPYNPNVAVVDRLYEAAADFRKTRIWPHGPTGIAATWDQFRLFVGLLSNTPVWTRTDKPPQEEEEDDDDEAEFAEETMIAAQTERGPKRPPPRTRVRPPYALYDVEPSHVANEDEVKVLLNNENARREVQMVEFVENPELQLRIFLSSYIRKQGLIWTDRNLINIPRLVDFFIRFLIRNRVFPEHEHERLLKRSMAIVQLAQKELILTSKIAKQIPDEFSKACFEFFGRKSEGYKPIDPIVEAENLLGKKETADDAPDGAPEAKRLKVDVNSKTDDGDLTAGDKFEEELKAANVEVIKVDQDVLIQEAEQVQIVKDNVNPDMDTSPAWAEEEGWGSTTDKADLWAMPAVDWEPVVKSSLFALLGPTALPITHTSGVVECSVRRVKSYTMPPAPATLPKSAVTDEEDADAVDIELERRFAKVVLAPWPDWDRFSDEMPHLAQPRILETSLGPIRGVVGTDGQVEPATGATEAPAGGPQPHDPFTDDIVLLVEPALLSMLSAGIGLGGTWVQIARSQDFGGEKKKKKKSKSKKTSTRYWYIDELVLTLPSYHI
ncbi:hypothetical protein C0991_002601 [Blastosporella zonata]|nr:hypothetical protein C0991_002601 [Blastosporella zonata]